MLLQVWWRSLQPRGRTTVWYSSFRQHRREGGHLTRAMLQEKLTNPIEATVKWDGTNVGRCCDGSMLGRRREIPRDKFDYQKASLAELKAADAKAVKESLLNACGAWPRCKLYIYGELMCNQLYDYTACQLDEAWLPFGAIVLLHDPHPAAGQDLAGRLTALGLLNQVQCDLEQGSVSIKLLNCPVLRQLLEEHNLRPQPPLFAFGSHYQMVKAMYHWMLGEQGEGLVVSPATEAANRLGLGLPAKWKCPSEPQFGNIKALEELQQLLRRSNVMPLLPVELPDMLRRLMGVATGGAIAESEEQSEDELVKSLPQP